MQRKTSNWLLGCGIGCVVLILGGVVLGTLGVMSVRSMFKGFSTAADTRQALDDRFGTVDDYTPPADGVIAPDRMAAFVAVREATQPERMAISKALAEFPLSAKEASEMDSKPFFEKLTKGLSLGRSAMGMAADMGRLFQKRNQALMDQGMGMGEYTWIYVIAYESWLSHSPGDGPANQAFRFDHDEDDGPLRHRGDNGRLLSRIHGNLVSMLRNQLAAVPDQPGQEAWRHDLEAQIEAMTTGTQRIPWEGGLPERMSAPLEPYREKLEATYDAAVNQFELARNRRSGRFSVQAD